MKSNCVDRKGAGVDDPDADSRFTQRRGYAINDLR
jgi:hypothetical protein